MMFIEYPKMLYHPITKKGQVVDNRSAEDALLAEWKALEKVEGGDFHPYRRKWSTERKHLPDVDVAASGGWSDVRALKQSYQQVDEATMRQIAASGGNSWDFKLKDQTGHDIRTGIVPAEAAGLLQAVDSYRARITAS